MNSACLSRWMTWARAMPVLVVLTSEADSATRYAFPTGRAFSTFFEKERDVERYNAVLDAWTHAREQITGEMMAAMESDDRARELSGDGDPAKAESCAVSALDRHAFSGRRGYQELFSRIRTFQNQSVVTTDRIG